MFYSWTSLCFSLSLSLCLLVHAHGNVQIWIRSSIFCMISLSLNIFLDVRVYVCWGGGGLGHWWWLCPEFLLCSLLGITIVLNHGLLNREFDRYDIVEEEHALWTGVSRPYRETIRAFLVYFQNEVP